MTALADTGFIVALALATDHWHDACLSIYRQQTTLYVPQTTLAEVAYLLARAGGNLMTARFLTNLSHTKYRLVALESVDVIRSAALLAQYADSRLDFVDATVVAVAERLDVTTVLTLDRRDFQIVRPQHCEYFDLQP
jgi:uncharacterized protein